MSVWLVAGTPVRRPVPVHAPRDPAMRQALPLPGRTDVDQLPQPRTVEPLLQPARRAHRPLPMRLRHHHY